VNGRTAKKLRKVFYTDDSPRRYVKFTDGEIRADSRRQTYKKAKRELR